MSEVAELARDLIEIPSPSGEEAAIGEFLIQRLKKRFEVRTEAVDASRINVLAVRGNPKVVFTIHMDTVPGALPVSMTRTSLTGRGACDAKGPLAAMIIAAEQAADAGYTDFGLFFDVDEEAEFAGITVAMKGLAKNLSPELVVVGEPTSLRLFIGQKGLLGLKLVSRGRAAHASTPRNGESAISRLLSALVDLENMTWTRDALYGETTLNIGTIKGGSAPNVVADYAEAGVDMRVVPGDGEAASRIVDGLKGVSVGIKFSYLPVRCTDENVVDALSARLSRTGLDPRPCITPLFTELYFWNQKAPSVILGPGDPTLAHTTEEVVSISELEKAVTLYREIVKLYGSFAGRNAKTI